MMASRRQHAQLRSVTHDHLRVPHIVQLVGNGSWIVLRKQAAPFSRQHLIQATTL
jgi:hypothetical protein